MFSHKPRTVMLSVRGIPSYHVFFGCEASQVYQSVLSNTPLVCLCSNQAPLLRYGVPS